LPLRLTMLRAWLKDERVIEWGGGPGKRSIQSIGNDQPKEDTKSLPVMGEGSLFSFE